MEFRKITVDELTKPTTSGYATYPRLRIQGRWLERAGFQSGDRVTLEVHEGLIVIKSNSPATNDTEENKQL